MLSKQTESTRQRGANWERKAEFFLQRRGLKTLTRNFHCRRGEIDLIMRDGEHLVFVEVRFRQSTIRGSGAETVGRVKQGRVINAARIFLASRSRLADLPCRFDVISICEHRGDIQFDWIRGAFEVQQGTHHGI
ncbi:MAG: YraN family protein [Xanthomonadales bacterium]|nr:YraN family protein [Xanthomonadales bacterium]NNL95862.1 YraN family protein [Xanthomonadales bacterium]